MILLENFVCILNKKTTPQYIKYTTLKSESSCLGQLSLTLDSVTASSAQSAQAVFSEPRLQ